METKQSIWTKPLVVFAAALFCCILWGSATPAIKIAYRLFRIDGSDTASRLMLAGARFTIAGIMTILFGSLLKRKVLVPKPSSWKYILTLAFVQTVFQYYFFFLSLANTTGVRGSIINASGNFLAILAAVYIFRMERMTARKWIGCIAGFLGIILLLGGFRAILDGGNVTLAGEGAMLGADIFYALSGCMIKLFSQKEDPVVLSGYQFLIGGIIVFLIGRVMGGSLVFYEPACILNLIYMGFISAGAYTVWGILLKYNSVSRISILGFLNPVMGVLLSALFLGENKEAFSWNGLLALVLVSLGIIIVNLRPAHESE
jgi:drug/metabolite transporter (DMT)-like permease